MAYKVNYGLQRAERDRAKQAKKEEKLREREAQAIARARAIEAGETPPEPAQDASQDS